MYGKSLSIHTEAPVSATALDLRYYICSSFKCGITNMKGTKMAKKWQGKDLSNHSSVALLPLFAFPYFARVCPVNYPNNVAHAAPARPMIAVALLSFAGWMLSWISLFWTHFPRMHSNNCLQFSMIFTLCNVPCTCHPSYGTIVLSTILETQIIFSSAQYLALWIAKNAHQ